jgi:hypothetical protein
MVLALQGSSTRAKIELNDEAIEQVSTAQYLGFNTNHNHPND